MMQENNSTHWIMGGALLLIGLFVIIALVMTRSQAANSNVEVINQDPSVSDLHFIYSVAGDHYNDAGLNAVTPNLQNARNVDVYFTVSDPNGTADLNPTNMGGAIYRDDAQAHSAICDQLPAENDGNQCQGFYGMCSVLSTIDSTSEKIKCANIPIQSWADPTAPGSDDYYNETWAIYANVKDASMRPSNTETITFEMNESTGTTVPGALNFGDSGSGSARALGFTSGTGNDIDFQFINIGNTDVDSQWYAPPGDGTGNNNTNTGAMHCLTGVIPPGAIKSNVGSDVAYASMALTLSTTPTDLDLEQNPSDNALLRRNSETTAPQIDWHGGIGIPSVGVAGMCQGNMVFAAIKDSVGGGGQ